MSNGASSNFGDPCLLRNWLYNYYCRSGFNNDLAEDLTQDTIVKLLLNAKSFRRDSSSKTWIYRIAFNIKMDYYRRMAKENHCEFIEEKYEADKLNPETMADRDNQVNVVRNLVGRLPTAQQRVIQLYLVEAWNYDELATDYCCSKSVLKVRVFRAMERLRKQLESTLEGSRDRFIFHGK